MSWEGTGNFKFTGTGTPDSTERELVYGVIDPEYQQPDLITKVNPLTGLRYFNLRGSYATFKIKYHLHKVGDQTAQNSMLTTLYSYLGNNVTNVKPRGTLILDDSTNTPVQFTVIQVSPYPIVENSDKDILLITLEATNYVDIGASLA